MEKTRAAMAGGSRETHEEALDNRGWRLCTGRWSGNGAKTAGRGWGCSQRTWGAWAEEMWGREMTRMMGWGDGAPFPAME